MSFLEEEECVLLSVGPVLLRVRRVTASVRRVCFAATMLLRSSKCPFRLNVGLNIIFFSIITIQ